MKLAVVIPAYKKAFFERSLRSLAAQTDRSFTVYIGDDFSPEDLKPIADRFKTGMDISYHRFSYNIGARDLVEQWRRCMTLPRNEEWIWFFSDDDLADPNCVEAFWRLQARTDGDVYRFNTCTIDENDIETGPTVFGPDFETSEEMALNLLLGLRGNSMPDHVFSKKVYLQKGFVSTPYAQAADWATSIQLSQSKGMRIIQEAKIHWRRAGSSISANVSKNRATTILGHYAFISWLLEHFKYLKTDPASSSISYEQIRQAAYRNLRHVLLWHYRGIPPALYSRHIRFLKKEFGITTVAACSELRHIVWTRLKHDRYERRMVAQKMHTPLGITNDQGEKQN